MAGWRARLGIMVPSVNKTMEPELYRLAPKGVSLHFSRIRQVEDTPEQLTRMIEDVPRAAVELSDAEVDKIRGEISLYEPQFQFRYRRLRRESHCLLSGFNPIRISLA